MELTKESTTNLPTVYKPACNACDSPSKYRCPRCSTPSCSLNCVKKHKIETGCNGIRDKTAYVKLADFTEKHLLNDYRFLEEADRIMNRKRRFDPTRAAQNQYRNKVSRLRDAARKRNINLILPMMMTTSQIRNSTRCFYARSMPLKSIMQWHVEWRFHRSTAIMKSVDENLTLQSLIDIVMGNTADAEEPGEISGNLEKLKHQFAESSPLLRQLILVQTKSKSQELSLYLVKREQNRLKTAYKKLDKSLSLLDNLRGETIYEHPIILICHGDESLESNVSTSAGDTTSEDSISSESGSGESTDSGSESEATTDEKPKLDHKVENTDDSGL